MVTLGNLEAFERSTARQVIVSTSASIDKSNYVKCAHSVCQRAKGSSDPRSGLKPGLFLRIRAVMQMQWARAMTGNAVYTAQYDS